MIANRQEILTISKIFIKRHPICLRSKKSTNRKILRRLRRCRRKNCFHLRCSSKKNISNRSSWRDYFVSICCF